MKLRATVGAGLLAVAMLAGPGVAAAAPIMPFQIAPSPYGNPNGSLDLPPVRCGIERTGPGVITVTGTARDRWGCQPYARIHWANLANGRTGVAAMSDGLHNRPAAATIRSGPGQVVLMLLGPNQFTTPGFATIDVR